MSIFNRHNNVRLVAATAATLLVALFLFGPESPSTDGGAALKVQIDPETGELVPVTGLDKAELERQMKQRLNRSAEGLPEVHHPDGRVSVELDGRFQSLSVATIDSAGQVHTGCVSNDDELEHFLNDDANQGGE